jgi:outer membrane protein OmpA-like peptidoglycan-associated protein
MRRPPSRPSAAKTLDDLRPLLVGPEQRRIQKLEERLDGHLVEMVAGVLPEAVTESRHKSDALAWAVEPIMERSVRETVRRDPGGFAEAISPAMGPAIRKAVTYRFRVLLQRFNAALNRSLSVESLRWRIEARRTRRPFAEVVLLRTLVYRVEQLFLIHRGSGLLLAHTLADDVPSQDPDQVSAMLSAIETFAHDAFREDARLERFRVGELVGWIEHGPSALLVAIVRGTAPEAYESVLREALERTHLEHAKALADFRGDPAPFAGTEDVLAGCLREHRKPPRRRWVGPMVAVGALVALLAIPIFLAARASRRDQQRFTAYADALRREPGLVVTAAERRAGRYVFAGLRDPLARDPATVLAQSGLDPAGATLGFEPFYSSDLRLVEPRAAKVLRPPGGVSLTFRKGTLEARGVAPQRWIERARSLALALPAVEAFDDKRLYDEESVASMRAMAGVLEGTELLFPAESTSLSADQRARLDSIAQEALSLLALSPKVGMTVQIDVVGYADPRGSEAWNQMLSSARARNVATELLKRGAFGGALSARGEGVRGDVEQDYQRARSVIFRVDLRAAKDG